MPSGLKKVTSRCISRAVNAVRRSTRYCTAKRRAPRLWQLSTGIPRCLVSNAFEAATRARRVRQLANGTDRQTYRRTDGSQHCFILPPHHRVGGGGSDDITFFHIRGLFTETMKASRAAIRTSHRRVGVDDERCRQQQQQQQCSCWPRQHLNYSHSLNLHLHILINKTSLLRVIS